MVSLPFLSFHVGELLGHLAVAHADDVDAPHVTAPVVPATHPAHPAPVAGGEALLRLQARRGRGLKERPPERAHRTRALEPLAVRRRQGVLEHAVGRHQCHHTVDVVAVERLVEPANDVERGPGRGVGHGGPSPWVVPDPGDHLPRRWPPPPRTRKTPPRSPARSTAQCSTRCRSPTPGISTTPGAGSSARCPRSRSRTTPGASCGHCATTPSSPARGAPPPGTRGP